MLHTPHYQRVESAPRDAPWIALVHGVSQNSRLFDRQVALLKSAYRLLLIDLPGHGESSHIPGPYGLQEYATSIQGALDDAGIGGCYFWGTHLGAGAGLLLACGEPHLFRALVLEAPVFPGRAPPSVSELRARLSKIARTQGMDAARDLWWHEGAWFDVMRSRPLECRAREHREMIASFGGAPWLDAGLVARPIAPIEPRASSLQIPILVINGEHDLPDFLEAAAALHEIFPRCHRQSVPQAGGFPLWEFPEAVTDLVRDFLAPHNPD